MKNKQIDIHHPIAIIGMDCYYPGARNCEEYWQTIISKQVFIKPIEDQSTGIPQIYDPDPKAYNKTNSNLGALVEDVEFPYKKFLGLPPVTVNTLNKMSRLSLIVAQKAIEDAHISKKSITNEKTYVVIANKEYDSPLESYADSSLYYRLNYLKETSGYKKLSLIQQKQLIEIIQNDFFKLNQKKSLDELIHSTAPALAARISKFNNFSGGITSVDSACASSFSAMDFAVKKLRSKTSDVAVVGGIGRIVPMLYVYCSKALTMSNKGSFPFDEMASGFISGEGVGFVVLKRLEDALKNQDQIHGVIRGISPSSDGSKTGPWAPCCQGQKLAVKRALTQTGYSFGDVQYIECHGTGTKVGDLEEIQGICELLQEQPYRSHPIALGSSKGGIGHLLTGAGMAGLFRTLLAIKHKTLPPTAGLTNLNSKLPLKKNNLFIPPSATDWNIPHNQQTRKAMVNCFGFGGTNYNLQLEEFNHNYHQEYFQNKNRSLLKINSYKNIHRSNLKDTFNSPIAITGIGFNIPGSSTYEQLIKNLENKNNFIKDMDSSRWDSFVGQKQDQSKWASSNNKGGYVNLPDPKDTFRWKIPPTTIKHIDPNQFRLFLAVEEALKQAGLIGKKEILQNTSMLCGVISDSDFMMREVTSLRYNYLKHFIEHKIDFIPDQEKDQIIKDFFKNIKNDLIEYNPDNSVSGVDSMLGSRVAKFFDIKGGSTAINSLCTTGLVGIDHACNSLRTKDLDASVVCASNMAMSGPVFCMHSDLKMMSPDGNLRPFDENRNGIVLGEGVVVFVLRRLEDALSNNENIYALIYNTDLANEGLSNQMVTTHKNTAKLCYQRCVDGLIDSPPVEYVECHGVGLGVGDQIEMESSLEVYGNSHVTIGSIKSSIGHLRVASSLASLLKAVVTLKEQKIFPTINVTSPDKYLLDHTQNITLATETLNFKEKTPFVAVSSIGVSGTCGHLIASHFNKFDWQIEKKEMNSESINHPQIISGSPFQKAQQLSQIYQSIFKQNDWLKKRLPTQIIKRQEKALANLQSYTPEYFLNELNELAYQLNIDNRTLMEINALSSVVTINYGECMGFALKDSHQIIHGANYDFPFLTKEENELVPRFLLEYQSENKLPFIGLFHAGSIFPLGGINNSQIAITYAASFAPKELGSGININVFIRKVLEECHNITDFKKILSSFDFEGSWIILLSSGKDNKTIMVEVFKNKKQIIESDELFHTNHFQHITDDEFKISPDSQIRLNRLFELINKSNSPTLDVKTILSDRFDLTRNKFTLHPTQNTLNRYNTGASLFFDLKNCAISISLDHIPAGDGPFQLYEFNPTLSEKPVYNNLSLDRWIPNTDIVFKPIKDESITSSVLVIIPQKNIISHESYNELQNLIQISKFDSIDINNNTLTPKAYDYIFDLSMYCGQITSPFEYNFPQYIEHIQFYKLLYKTITINKKIISCGFKDDKYLDLHGEALRAFYLSLGQDYPSFKTTHITLPINQNWKNIFNIFNTCITSKNLPTFLELFNHDLFIKKYILSYQNNLPLSSNYISNNSFLITGGARGITAEIGIALAKMFKGRFIVIGRSDLPKEVLNISKNDFLNDSLKKHPNLKPKDHLALFEKHQRSNETLRNLKRYSEQGVEINYENIDLSDNNLDFKIKALIKKYGKINHVIHGAGIEYSKKFFDKSIDDFKRVFFSKTISTTNLLRPFLDLSIDTITLFSSTSGINGNIGQTDYSSCNAIHFCLPILLKKYFPNTLIKSIAWPAWGETGMAMNDSVFSQMSSNDIKFISVEDGVSFFINEFCSRAPQSSCICTNTNFDATTNFPFYQDLNERDLIKTKHHLTTNLSYIDHILSYTEKIFVAQKMFTGKEVFLTDHLIGGKPTVPGVVLTEMILQNLHLWSGHLINEIAIKQISFLSPTQISSLDSAIPLTLTTTLKKQSNDEINFDISTAKYRTDGQILLKSSINCQGVATVSSNANELIEPFPYTKLQLDKLSTNPLRNKTDFYCILHDKFPEKLGPSFQNLVNVLWVDDHTLLATAKITPNQAFGDGLIFINGGIFDIINQLMVENRSLTSKEQTFIPGNYYDIKFLGEITTNKLYYIYLSDINLNSDKITFVAKILNSDLKTVLLIKKAEHIKYFKRNT